MKIRERMICEEVRIYKYRRLFFDPLKSLNLLLIDYRDETGIGEERRGFTTGAESRQQMKLHLTAHAERALDSC